MRDCNQCGKCCTRYGGGGLAAAPREIARWETTRPDIAAYVRDGKIWIDPATGKQTSSCPWLFKLPGQPKYGCRIYEERPDDCRVYPISIDQMLIDECEMLEKHDLADRRRAQRQLDALMSDSRPPLDKP